MSSHHATINLHKRLIFELLDSTQQDMSRQLKKVFKPCVRAVLAKDDACLQGTHCFARELFQSSVEDFSYCVS
jgi:hypothetical protein